MNETTVAEGEVSWLNKVNSEYSKLKTLDKIIIFFSTVYLME